jgi:hypothetical protein
MSRGTLIVERLERLDELVKRAGSWAVSDTVIGISSLAIGSQRDCVVLAGELFRAREEDKRSRVCRHREDTMDVMLGNDECGNDVNSRVSVGYQGSEVE